MALNGANRRFVLGLGLVAIILVAAAGIVAALEVRATWAVGLGVAAVVLGAIAGIVDKIVIPRAEARQRAQDEDDRAQAIVLTLMRDKGEVSLAATNQDRYEVASVRVTCWPDVISSELPHQLPVFAPATSSEISWDPIAGGGQCTTVTSIQPSPIAGSGTGPKLGAWTAPPLPTLVVFEVDWLDHQRRARRLVGRADLSSHLPITIVKLSPPPSLTTTPTRHAPIRRPPTPAT